MSRSSKHEDGISAFGFRWGPMVVERLAADDRIGWVLIVRDREGKERAQVRVSPAGRKWSVTNGR